MLSTLVVFIGIVNLFSGLAIIFLVLMQQGKGADAGANFGGGGSSQGLFGAAGAANFLSRSTAVAATIFFSTCLMLAYTAAKQGSVVGDSVKTAMPFGQQTSKNLSPPTLPDSNQHQAQASATKQVSPSSSSVTHNTPVQQKALPVNPVNKIESVAIPKKSSINQSTTTGLTTVKKARTNKKHQSKQDQ